MKQPEDNKTADLFDPVKELLAVSEDHLLNQPLEQQNDRPQIVPVPVSTAGK